MKNAYPALDRVQRWQKISMDQLGYVGSVILTLTLAGLGYSFALLRDPEFEPGRIAKHLMLIALALLMIAVCSGVVCTFVRLLDFRGTAKRARRDPEAPEREWLDTLGRATWGLLYVQLS